MRAHSSVSWTALVVVVAVVAGAIATTEAAAVAERGVRAAEGAQVASHAPGASLVLVTSGAVIVVLIVALALCACLNKSSPDGRTPFVDHSDSATVPMQENATFSNMFTLNTPTELPPPRPAAYQATNKQDLTQRAKPRGRLSVSDSLPTPPARTSLKTQQVGARSHAQPTTSSSPPPSSDYLPAVPLRTSLKDSTGLNSQSRGNYDNFSLPNDGTGSLPAIPKRHSLPASEPQSNRSSQHLPTPPARTSLQRSHESLASDGGQRDQDSRSGVRQLRLLKQDDLNLPIPPPRPSTANSTHSNSGSTTPRGPHMNPPTKGRRYNDIVVGTDGGIHLATEFGATQRKHQHHQQQQPNSVVATSREAQMTSASVAVQDVQFELRKKQVDREGLELKCELGSGYFGVVYLAAYFDGKAKHAVAVKSLRQDEDFDDEQKRLFLMEAQIMAEFNHPNLLFLVGVTTTEEPWCIITEACEFGDLRTVLRKSAQTNVSFNLDEQLYILAQIALGMSYLAKKHFIHRDLAARNCLVAGDGSVKIGDFGLSRMLQLQKDYYAPSSVTDNAELPLRWMAVESLKDLKFSVKSDVWSFGIVCFEVFSYGGQPYGPINPIILQDEIESGLRPAQPSECPNEIYSLMQTMWLENPSLRPTFTHIYNTLSRLLRDELLQIANKRDFLRLLHVVVKGDMPSSSDPYKDLDGSQIKNSMMRDLDYEDHDDEDDYKDLDGGQVDYIPASSLPTLLPDAMDEMDDTVEYVCKDISRTAAERLLLSQGKFEDIQGLFLLRESSSGSGYALSVVDEDRVLHFRITQEADGLNFLGTTFADEKAFVDAVRQGGFEECNHLREFLGYYQQEHMFDAYGQI